jgi:type I restriction-modification system DNA methylase subunit
MPLSLREIEEKVIAVGNSRTFSKDFIFDLLLAYGRSPGNVTRLKSEKAGSLNIADDPQTSVAQKNIVYFKTSAEATEEALLTEVESLSKSQKVMNFSIRFAIVTNLKTLLAKDTRTGETRSFGISQIADHFTFFLPWAGMEKTQFTSEAHADVKAAERMAKLFDEIILINPEYNAYDAGRHSLNIFFSRLLFCFFAEDTGIFLDGQFTNAVGTYSRIDGSDVRELLTELFSALDSKSKDSVKNYLADFPYVNGQLFSAKSTLGVPKFNKKSRDLLLESSKLKWSDINPDIFGSMFQAIVKPDQRSDLGQHYTSVPNILKTIEPLFLDSLKSELELHFDRPKKLETLLDRISKISIFDPACGSGNFLVIAYKELRKLEHAILERLGELRGSHHGLFGSCIDIQNFYGIELDDFACEVAVLSLWIAKHQMNVDFTSKFGTDVPLIPLKEMGQIKHGNAARVDWDSVCANDKISEIYVIGNPPYKGTNGQTKSMKEDFEFAFAGETYSKNLDYISIWFKKGARYIKNSMAQLAFVSTNSVTQGDHVGILAPHILEDGLEIGYAHPSFKWENNAKNMAGVTVVVINLRSIQNAPKFLYLANTRIAVSNINGYLADSPNIVVAKTLRPQNGLPEMVAGSKPNDGGALILDRHELEELLIESPEAEKFVRRFMGSFEFINNVVRYALWIWPQFASEAASISPLARRFEKVVAHRLESERPTTISQAATPWKFGEARYKETQSIIVPAVSSERRNYIPIGYLGKETVISNAAFAVYDAEPWVFALITSRMHMTWTRAVCGKMKNDYRYSSTLVYNTFPLPALTPTQKDRLSKAAFKILDVREYFSDQILAALYDPESMPNALIAAHEELDALVDGIYRKRSFVGDEDRLSQLFDMYQRSTSATRDEINQLEFNYE